MMTASPIIFYESRLSCLPSPWQSFHAIHPSRTDVKIRIPNRRCPSVGVSHLENNRNRQTGLRTALQMLQRQLDTAADDAHCSCVCAHAGMGYRALLIGCYRRNTDPGLQLLICRSEWVAFVYGKCFTRNKPIYVGLNTTSGFKISLSSADFNSLNSNWIFLADFVRLSPGIKSNGNR